MVDDFSNKSFKESDFSKAFVKGMDKAKVKKPVYWKCNSCGKKTKVSKERYFEYHSEEKWLECDCEGWMKPIFCEEEK